MPDTLPKDAKKLWEQVYNERVDAGDSEATAAKKAYGAIANAGWYQDENKKWHKKADVVEFSLSINKASFDPKTQEMCWRAQTSDIDTDSHGDNMTMELFSSFLRRIESGEPPVYEEYKSEFWAGGMPYISVSHYPDLNGDAVPGVVDAAYIDGKFFKAKGRFNDTPLGKACWNSIRDDIKQKSNLDPVRISIAFLDYKHRHKDTGYVFERKLSEDEVDFCPECLLARLKGERPTLEYMDGHLIHLAMTRVPVNKRTLMEVDKSMVTRKEDAASIIGEELAEEIEEKATLVGKSEALVIKADDEETKEEIIEEPVEAVVEEVAKSNTIQSLDIENAVMDALGSLSQKMDLLINALQSRSEVKPKKDDEEDDEMDDEEEEKACAGKKKKKEMSEIEEVVPAPVDLVAAFSEAVAPITQRLDMLIAAQAPHKSEVPARRSISPAGIQQVSRADNQPKPGQALSIRQFVNRSVGLE